MRNYSVFGLTLGLAACIFIGLYVVDEWGYDRYNTNADRIFRIAADLHINGGAVNDVSTPSPMAATLTRDFPAIEKAVRIRDIRKGVNIRIGNTVFAESGVVLADPTLFSIFTLPFINGDARTALSQPNSVVLSATTAEKYFNSPDVVGRTLQMDDDTAMCTVTGVIRDMPSQSHFHFNLIRSLKNDREEWINFYAATYVLARPGIRTTDLDQMLAQTVQRYVYKQVRDQLHNSPEDLRKKGDYFRYYSIPLTQIHLHSNLGGEFEPNGNSQYVLIFVLAAIMILLVAGVNFVNLSIAGNFRRLRGIGVRKILGASRRRLVGQFLLRSIATTALAMAAALLLVVLLLPVFNQLAGKSFSIGNVLSRRAIPVYLLTILTVGCLAGMYPALELSRVQPLAMLRGQLMIGAATIFWRRALLVVQFSVAMILVIDTGVIYSQLSYVSSRNLGYDRQQVVTIKNTQHLQEGLRPFVNETRRLPGVTNATVSGFLPNQKVVLRGFFNRPGRAVTSTVLLGDWQVDPNFIPTLDMKLAAGRNFSPDMPTDSGCILINETAARALGYAQPLDRRLYTYDDTVLGYRIIGVVKDFNTGSMRNPIDPLVFRLGGNSGGITFRLAAGDISSTIQAIKQKYAAIANGQPFIYTFLDDDFNKLYAGDRKMETLFTIFSALALVIAWLGIFGLSMAAAQQRTKELGIRRVLGARVAQLTLLLIKEYGLAIGLAMLIALPLGAWLMHNWLQGFVYRTGLQVWIFVLAPLAVIVVAIAIVAIRAGRAASVPLAEILRVE